MAGFDPNQPRDKEGKWTESGAASARVAAHAARVAAGLAPDETMKIYMRPDGTWDPDRQKLHDKIIAKYFEGKTPVENPRAYLLGGGCAAGKSTLLRSGALNIPENAVACDADAIKLMLPEMQEGIANGDLEAAALVHEESSYLSKKIAARAGDNSYNLYMDGTGDSHIESLTRKVNNMRGSGQTVEAMYVTIDTETAVARAWARAAETGRMVPEAVIRASHANVSRTFPEAIKAGLFDKVTLWDTAFNPPKMIAYGYGDNLTILDEKAYAAFLAKVNGG